MRSVQPSMQQQQYQAQSKLAVKLLASGVSLTTVIYFAADFLLATQPSNANSLLNDYIFLPQLLIFFPLVMFLPSLLYVLIGRLTRKRTEGRTFFGYSMAVWGISFLVALVFFFLLILGMGLSGP